MRRIMQINKKTDSDDNEEKENKSEMKVFMNMSKMKKSMKTRASADLAYNRNDRNHESSLLVGEK